MLFWNTRPIRLFIVFLALGFFLLPTEGLSQETMTVVQPLSFGQFSLKNNNAQHQIIINAATGTVTPDPAYVVATPAPQRGEYFLDNLPASTIVNVTIVPGNLTLGGGGPPTVFTVDNYTVHPNPVTTNASGEATVYVGGTLKSTGNTIMYDSGYYEGDIDITFDW